MILFIILAVLYINNLIVMKSEQKDNPQPSQKLDVSRKSLSESPANAIDKLKSINQHIEMMKNRYLVLRRRDEHNKYKTLDQQKKINFHHMIHNRLKDEREQLRKSLEEIRDIKEIKQRSQRIRKQMQESVVSAKKQIVKSSLQRYEQINEDALKHKEIIDSNKQTDLIINRSKALSLKRMQQQEKQIIELKLKNKIQHILANKSVESNNIKQKSAQAQKILEKLEKNQVQMIKQASNSMANSRLMSQKYTEIMMMLPSLKSKKADSIEKSFFLPHIKQKTNNSMQILVV